MQALPWVISVDDHVVEPPHVWQRPAARASCAIAVRASCRTRCETIVRRPRSNVAIYMKGGPGPSSTGGSTRTC